MFDAVFIERFWRNVDVKGKDECWPWFGAKRKAGYGTCVVEGRSRPAHQVSWCIHNSKEWPQGLQGRHHCDNPTCVNPHHMTPGTAKENVRDMIERGRDGGFTRKLRDATHCARGHEYTPENTHIRIRWGTETRRCISCRRQDTKAYKLRHKDKANGK